jgi:hypothetical protein
MKQLIYFLLIMIVLASCKKEPNKNVNPSTKSVITGKVLDEATNSPITEGRVVLLRPVENFSLSNPLYITYDLVNLDQNGSFRFEFTYSQCYDCQYVRHEFPPYNTMPYNSISLDRSIPKYANVNKKSFFEYFFDNYTPYWLQKGYGVGDKSEDITFYYHSLSKLKVNYISITPITNNDTLRVSINKVILGYAGLDIFNGLYTANVIPSNKVLSIENIVLANQTCTITSRIRKNGQVTVKSQDVVLEPFSTKEVNIEY